MNHTIWIRILIIALCLSACRAAPDLVEQAGADTPAAEAPRVVDQAQPADDVAGETDRALSLDQLFADLEEAAPGARATVDDLSDLTSYRLVTSILAQVDDFEMTTTHTVEWARDAQAYRRTQTDDVSGISVGFLWIGERAWMLAGNEWMEIQSEEDPDPLDELAGLLEWDEKMRLVGEEVVNGMRCRRYVGDEIVFPHATVQQEVCVADQPGIPPLIIHSRMRMVQEGQITITEHTLYDINQPMTIEPPG